MTAVSAKLPILNQKITRILEEDQLLKFMTTIDRELERLEKKKEEVKEKLRKEKENSGIKSRQ